MSNVKYAQINLIDDLTPTLAGELTVGEFGIKFDEALSGDGTYSGIVCDGISGYTSTAFGELVYLDPTSHRWEKTDANAAATAGPVMLGLALTIGADGAAIKILLKGFIMNTAWTFTPETALFVSAAATAEMVHAAPAGSGDIVRVVGYCHDNADTVFFDPAKSWVEIV